jgi:hypothetical protein
MGSSSDEPFPLGSDMLSTSPTGMYQNMMVAQVGVPIVVSLRFTLADWRDRCLKMRARYVTLR